MSTAVMMCVCDPVMMQPYVYSRHDVMRLWPCHDAALCLQLSWCVSVTLSWCSLTSIAVMTWCVCDPVMMQHYVYSCHDVCLWPCHNAVLCLQLSWCDVCLWLCHAWCNVCVSTIVIMVGLGAYIFIQALADGKYSNLSSCVISFLLLLFFIRMKQNFILCI